MRPLLLLLVAFCCFLCPAQMEKSVYKAAVLALKKNYNEQNYSALFQQFSPEMQAALPPDKTKEFFTGLNQNYGKITGLTFQNYLATYAVYKTVLERGTLAVNVSVDGGGRINGILFKPYTEEALPTPERNLTPLSLPFKGEWTVTWGGDTKDLNYHVENRAQKNAFDFVITDPTGRSYLNNGGANDDYYAFGKEILAPCDGEIVVAIDGIKDNKPHISNAYYGPGNSVVIKTSNNEYLFFAHFKNHTIRVKENQKIRRGEVLGLCGNTGNSSEPHLHFHIQNAEDINVSTGIKAYFSEIVANGKAVKDYSPVRNDKVKPAL